MGNDAGNAHIFAAVHDLNGGDVELLAEAESSDGAAGFVVDVEDVVVL